MPDRRQKKLEKHKKERSQATYRPRATPAAEAQTKQAREQALGFVASCEMGPCFVTQGWHRPDTPRRHCVLVTHKLPEEHFAVAGFWLDLGCEGLKDVFFIERTDTDGVKSVLRRLMDLFGAAWDQVRPEVASGVVQKAIAYAKALEIEPPESALAMLQLLSADYDRETPVALGRWGKPLYSPALGEDTRPMVLKLVRAVGPDGFTVELPPRASDPDASSGTG